jgi:hypothetical protein
MKWRNELRWQWHWFWFKRNFKKTLQEIINKGGIMTLFWFVFICILLWGVTE